ncbi:hypothetical protein HYU11_03795 [Candidatus Woesearchaeota archaeon]|nr:hypothetical protein [Candidatus Woesearchaeota archaeon]
MALNDVMQPDFTKRSGSIVAIVQGALSGIVLEDRWIGSCEWDGIFEGYAARKNPVMRSQRKIARAIGMQYKVLEAYLDCDRDAALIRVDDQSLMQSMKSFYAGLKECQPNFDRTNLIVAIAFDEKGRVLMQGFQNPEAFNATMDQGRMVYWSTSREELWCKGLTSGCFQTVKGVGVSKDGLSAVYMVRQEGLEGACHVPGQYSCFFNRVM